MNVNDETAYFRTGDGRLLLIIAIIMISLRLNPLRLELKSASNQNRKPEAWADERVLLAWGISLFVVVYINS